MLILYHVFLRIASTFYVFLRKQKRTLFKVRFSERKKLFDYSQQRQHLLPIGKSGVEPESAVRNAVCFSLKLHSVSRRMKRRLFSEHQEVCFCLFLHSIYTMS
nr:MAG TPA: hypothetical protein [Caudoviricetes sp.]